MERITKLFVLVIVILALMSPAFARDLGLGRASCCPPEPRLLYPISDTLILTGKDFVEFKWINDFFGIDYYDFRLYRGYDTYAAGLILKQRIPQTEGFVRIKSELFINNQVYTWVLRQVSFGGKKSDSSFSSFRVIKK